MATSQRCELPATRTRVIQLVAEQARVTVRWAGVETVAIEHDGGVERSVEPAGNRLSIGAVGLTSSGYSRVQVGEQGSVVRLGNHGGISIGPHGPRVGGPGAGTAKAGGGRW